MSAKVRAFDWASHPLGPMAGWPDTLRVVLELMLASHFPKCLVWGERQTTFHNDAYRPLLGDKPDALGRPFPEVWHETWHLVGDMAQRALAGQASFWQDAPFTVQRYGYPEPTFFTFGFSPVRDVHGAVGGYVVTIIETTQSNHAQQQLRAEASSLEQQVVQRTADRDRLWSLSDALMMVARLADGVIVSVNPGWTVALGWSEAETVGRHVRAFVLDEDAAELDAEGTLLRAGAPRRQVRMRLLGRDGQLRTVAWSVVSGDGFLHAIGRDETEELSRALELTEAQERLRQGQKMEAIGQLTGGIAHDFNNMLQGIVLPLQLMQRRLQQGRVQEVGSYIDTALASARRAASLTQRLLAFSRRQPLDVRAVDVAAVLAGLQTMLRSSCGENIALSVQADEDLWLVCTDLHQLENAVLNLAINARDAMPAGGRLHLQASNAARLGEHGAGSGSSGLAAGDYVRLSVSDSGTGMAGDVIERAFDPFFTTKPIGLGTGLGLSMIYGYMRQTSGAVEIDSQPGVGTTVHLYLPRCAEELQPAAPAVLHAQTHERRHDAVLVVEDDATVRATVVELLQELGFQIMQAADGHEAMALLSGALQFDLLVTDVGLPGPNGRQVADLARERLPAIQVLLMTGYAERAASSDSLVGDGMELLVKPFDAGTFMRKVQQMMGCEGQPPT